MRRVPYLVLSILLGVLVLAAVWAARKYAADRDRWPVAPADEAGASERQAAAEPRQPGTRSAAAVAGPTAVSGDGTTTCPPGYPVKGKGSSKIFHLPGQQFYDITVATQCFTTAEAAVAAGYRASKR